MLNVLNDATGGKKPTTGVGLDDPTVFVATPVQYAVTEAAIVIERVAEVPAPLIATLLIDGFDEELESANANVEPLRFAPVTVRVAVVPASMVFGDTDVITGIGRTWKFE